MFVSIVKAEKYTLAKVQKQSLRDVLLNRSSVALQQICRKTRKQRCNFKKVAIAEHLYEE